MAAENADSQSACPDMGSNAHSQRRVNQFHIRKVLLHFSAKGCQRAFVHWRICNSHFQYTLLLQMRKTGRNIIFYRLQHDPEGGLHAPGFGVGIQFAALYGENRLQTQYGADCCRGGGDPSAFFQIFQRIYGNIDAGVQSFLFQDLFDFCCCFSFFCQSPGIIYRVSWGTEMRWLFTTYTFPL